LTKQQLHASLDHIDARCAQFGIPKPVTFCYPGFSHSLQAVKVLDEDQYLFARRGVSPEYRDEGRGGRGPAYDPKLDHPLLVPTTWYSGPASGFEDMKWAVSRAKDGKIAVLCFHGVPALEHPWVSTEQQDFIRCMKYLKQSGCTVISMRELARYVDPYNRPDDPYAITKTRISLPLKRAQSAEANHALKDAARLGNIEDVKQHLAAGVDVNATDDDGVTPLDFAVKYGHDQIVVLLRKYGGKTGEELKDEGK
ncbi:MAG: ankyrin repeat domain-containing protein, partial [Verrucomicrobiota bacterium]|nr:ankyrin repeat domain-containing protein [Verrucomicrobiota bacterium]